MTYKLFGSPGTASMCIHWMLIELGATFEYELVDFKTKQQHEAAYRKINPTGHVPALMIDGTVYAETAALLMLLAEHHPQKAFAPAIGAPDRAAYLQEMIYLANTLMPAFRLWFYADEGAGSENVEATKVQARVRIERAWDRIDKHLSDGRSYAVGTHMTAADFLTTMLMRWSRAMPKTAAEWPHIAKYITRMRVLPSYRETHNREGLEGWI